MTARAAIYPTEVWRIKEASLDLTLVACNKTIFALGNGHLGMRGNFEEGRCTAVVGTYINGFFEETPVIYGEIAYGYAKNCQVMVNMADAKVIRLFVDGEPLDMSSGSLFPYERSLDLKEDVLVCSLMWRSPGGREIELIAGSSSSCGGMPPRSKATWRKRLPARIPASGRISASGLCRRSALRTAGAELYRAGNEEHLTGPDMHRGSRRAGGQRPSRRGGHQYQPR
jgi:hypothetical protein